MAKYYSDGVCRYLLDDTGPDSPTYSVDKCPRQMTDIRLPDSIDGIKVTKISSLAFNCKTIISKLSLPTSLEEIGDFAFNSCVSLKRIVIPAAVSSIGKNAFSGCVSLESVVIPRSVVSIGEGAFEDSDALEGIYVERDSYAHKWLIENLPDAINAEKVLFYDGDDAGASPVYDFKFTIKDGTAKIESYCGDSETVVIPQTIMGCRVSQIASNAFAEGSMIKSLHLPSTLTRINVGAFEGCTGLESFSVDEASVSYRAVDGVLFSKPMRSLLHFPMGKKCKVYAIPSDVSALAPGAFYGCRELTGITIPKTISKIPANCFSMCVSLRSVILPPSIMAVEHDAFAGCSSLTSVTVSPLLQKLGNGVFDNCPDLKYIYVIPGTPSVDIIKSKIEDQSLICAAPAMYYTECMPYLSDKLKESGMDMSQLGTIMNDIFGGSIDLSSLTGSGEVSGFSDLMRNAQNGKNGQGESDEESHEADDAEKDDIPEVPDEEETKEKKKKRTGNISGITIIKSDGTTAENSEIDGILEDLSKLLHSGGRDDDDEDDDDFEGIDHIFDIINDRGGKKRQKKKPSKPEDPTKAISDESFKEFMGKFDSVLKRADESLKAASEGKPADDESD